MQLVQMLQQGSYFTSVLLPDGTTERKPLPLSTKEAADIAKFLAGHLDGDAEKAVVSSGRRIILELANGKKSADQG